MKLFSFNRFSRNATLVSLLALASLAAIEPVQSHAQYWEQKKSLFDILPVNESDIVFLGNSITDGGEFAELFNNPNVKNRGINSDVISGIKKRLQQVTDGKPAKIFLLIGINDISHGKTPSQIAAEYDMLVKEIHRQSPSTKLYIQSIMPIDNSFGRYRNLKGREKNITATNTLLKEMALRNGDIFIDLWPVLSSPEGTLKKDFTNDGLHLTGAGYLAWTSFLKPFITDNKSTSPRK